MTEPLTVAANWLKICSRDVCAIEYSWIFSFSFCASIVPNTMWICIFNESEPRQKTGNMKLTSRTNADMQWTNKQYNSGGVAQ